MWASRRRPTWFQQNLPLLHTLLHNPGKRFAVTRKALVGLKAKVGPQTSTIKATILVMKTTQQWRALYNVTSTTHTQKKKHPHYMRFYEPSFPRMNGLAFMLGDDPPFHFAAIPIHPMTAKRPVIKWCKTSWGRNDIHNWMSSYMFIFNVIPL